MNERMKNGTKTENSIVITNLRTESYKEHKAFSDAIKTYDMTYYSKILYDISYRSNGRNINKDIIIYHGLEIMKNLLMLISASEYQKYKFTFFVSVYIRMKSSLFFIARDIYYSNTPDERALLREYFQKSDEDIIEYYIEQFQTNYSIHSENMEPRKITTGEYGTATYTETWYTNGELHRENEPAIIQGIPGTESYKENSASMSNQENNNAHFTNIVYAIDPKDDNSTPLYNKYRNQEGIFNYDSFEIFVPEDAFTAINNENTQFKVNFKIKCIGIIQQTGPDVFRVWDFTPLKIRIRPGLEKMFRIIGSDIIYPSNDDLVVTIETTKPYTEEELNKKFKYRSITQLISTDGSKIHGVSLYYSYYYCNFYNSFIYIKEIQETLLEKLPIEIVDKIVNNLKDDKFFFLV